MTSEQPGKPLLDDEGRMVWIVDGGWRRCERLWPRDMAVLFYDDGSVRFQHQCDRGERGVLVCAPLLQIGNGHRIVTARPLTIRESIACGDCNIHGYVTDDAWHDLTTGDVHRPPPPSAHVLHDQGMMTSHRDGEPIGHGHRLTWSSWAPDRELNPQYADMPDVERIGATISHPSHGGPCTILKADGTPYDPPPLGTPCAGHVTFDTPEGAQLEPDPDHRWQVEQWDPLTLSPSVLCRRCGDHGYVREGRWVPA